MIKLNFTEADEIDPVKIREIISFYRDLISADIEIKIEYDPKVVRVTLDDRLTELAIKEGSITKTAKTAVYMALKAYTGISLPWGSLTGVKPLKKMISLLEEGMAPEAAGNFFRNTYDVSNDKISLMKQTLKNQWKYLYPKTASVGLYIHIPLCISKCSYCSFPSSITTIGSDLCDNYLSALLYELEAIGNHIRSRGFFVDCVYVGGGTPSVLSETQIVRLMNKVIQIAPESKEITFEAGRSDTLSRSKLGRLKESGVTRISLNPQTSNEETLKKINRGASFSEFLLRYEEAIRAGFDQINCDLILGLADEAEEDYLKSLTDVLRLSPSSITLHSLCAKRTAELSVGEIFCNSGNISIFHEKAKELLVKRGFSPYYLYKQKNALSGSENTGFCLPGKECIYNIRMMGDKQTIFSAGANSSTKIVGSLNDDYQNIYNVKELNLYMNNIKQIVIKKMEMIKNIEIQLNL